MIKDMDWWNKMVFPVRRVWVSVSTRVKARKNGGGLLKLHDDIQTCGYEDVQVMWEMLRRSDSDVTSNQTAKRKQRPFWRVFVLTNSNRSDSSSFAPSHA